jgi:hypothetical protein
MPTLSGGTIASVICGDDDHWGKETRSNNNKQQGKVTRSKVG